MKYAKVEIKESYDKEVFTEVAINFTTKKKAETYLIERGYHKVHTMAEVDHYRNDKNYKFAEISWGYFNLADATITVEKY
jgi:hypothetical protein